MTTRTLFLTEELYHYMNANSLHEPQVLQELRERTASLPNSIMQICPEQGQLMRLLIELMGARRTIEVGVFTGYSSLSVALALPADGYILACDINEEWTQIARESWLKAGVANKIDLVLAPALDTLNDALARGEANTYDFAFIDADKTNYKFYFEKCLELVRPGGLIAFDNIFFHGKVAHVDTTDTNALALHELNLELHKDERVSISIVPIGDGLTLAMKRK